MPGMLSCRSSKTNWLRSAKPVTPAQRGCLTIYKTHPPQDPSDQQPVWCPDKAKDALQTAIAHYSSDLAIAHDQREVNRASVLQEEIRKALTAKYFIFSPAC